MVFWVKCLKKDCVNSMKKKIVKLCVALLSCALCSIASVSAQESAVAAPEFDLESVLGTELEAPETNTPETNAAAPETMPLNINIYKQNPGSPKTGDFDSKYSPFGKVDGALVQDGAKSVNFVTDEFGHALVNAPPNEMVEIICEEGSTEYYGSEEVKFDEELQSGKPLRLLLSENGLSRLSDDPDDNIDELPPVDQYPSEPMSEMPMQYSPYSGTTGGGWGALLGLTGLTGLVGIGEPAPVSPSH